MYEFILFSALISALTLVLCWILLSYHRFSYWPKKGVPVKSPSYFAGNINKVLVGSDNLYVHLENLYKWFKNNGHVHGGIYFFNYPVYMPVSPKIVKNILATNFAHFTDRGVYYDENNPMSANLFSMPGERWKALRTKLSSAFTNFKLRSMFDLIFMRNTQNLMENLGDKVQADELCEINTKRLLDNFTIDVIASSAFGLEANTLNDPDSKIPKILSQVFNPPLWVIVKVLLQGGFGNPGNALRASQSSKEVKDFFVDITVKTLRYREENSIVRDDLFSSLMEIKNSGGMSMNELVGQTFIFFLAGYETTSSTMSFALHELAHNQEIQERLRKEIYENLGKDFTKFTYDGVTQLPYLDKVVKESLRMYPTAGFLNRICVKDFNIPDSDVVIEKGTPVIISVLGIHRDPDFYPDPLDFDPERFATKDNHVPFTYLPFGEGPRICIGLRYGLLQAKLAIASMISQFKFYPSEKTRRLIEFDKSARTPVLAVKGGLFVNFSKIP